MRRALFPILAFVAGLVLLSAVALLVLLPQGRQIVGAKGVGGPFTLTNQDGRTVTEHDFAGKTHLVFFGFTHCPDICPTTLQQISDMLTALGPRGKDLKVAFITVDPERDTPEALKLYLASFDPRITGLTGTPEQVAAAVKAYRVYARKVPGKDGDYTMNHATTVYIMDAENAFVTALNLARPPQDSAAELAKYL